MMVSAVQIGRVTIPVPPSAMERNGTVTAVKIIVVVLCGERQTFVTGQRITSSSYKSKKILDLSYVRSIVYKLVRIIKIKFL